MGSVKFSLSREVRNEIAGYIDKEFIIKEELNPHEVKVYSFVKSYR